MLQRTVIGAALLLCCACATSPSQPPAARGTVTVGVTTTGPASARAATFTVTIEPAGITGAVKADAGVFSRDSVPPGDHVVRLLDVPAGCRVEGGAERRISIAARASAVVRFAVQCR